MTLIAASFLLGLALIGGPVAAVVLLPPVAEPPNESLLPCAEGRCPCEAVSCELPCVDCCPGAKPEGCVPSPSGAR